VRKNEAILDLGLLDELPTKIIQKAFWLAGPLIGEWGHFVNTYLVKLLHYVSVNELQEISILIPNDLPENIREILFKLDNQNQCIEISRLEKVFIEDCYYFPSTVFAPTNGRKFGKRIQSNVYVDPEKFWEMFKIIRKEFSLSTIQKFPKKVLWARPNLSRRVLKNQTDFEKIVSDFGFTTFDPLNAENFDQFQVLYNADYICGEIGSWIYLAGLNPTTKIIVVLSDWDQHWWNEIGSLNKNLLYPIMVLLGKRINIDDYKSENAPHGEYQLSSKSLYKLRNYLERQL
jgi:capsular polysaccharide biosynthesis protein